MNKMYNDFLSQLNTLTDSELIKNFNNEVGNTGWTSARGAYLVALRDTFVKRNIDISAVSDETSFSFARKVRLEAGKVVLAG